LLQDHLKVQKNVFSLNECDEKRLFHIFFWILLVGSLLVFFWGIWSIPLLTHNEGRRLVVLQEMLAGNNWLIPTMNGQIYLEKPPLFYWVGSFFGLLSKSSAEWVMRLPCGMSAFAATWLLFARLKKQIGDWSALFAVLILVTSYFFTQQARVGELDMLLAFCLFASVLFYYGYLEEGRSRLLYAAYSFLGLAFMTKGPFALLFFLPPILLYGVLYRNKEALYGLINWRGWLLFSIIALPWFLYINHHFHGAPLWGILKHEIAYKMQRERDPFYFYLRHFAGGVAPWFLVFFWRPRTLFKLLFRNVAGQFFGLAFLVPLIIFSLFTFKSEKYILPVYPALAVLLGMALGYWFEEAKQRWKAIPIALTAFSGFLIVLLIVFYLFIQPHVMSYRFEALKPLAARLDHLRGNNPVYFLGKVSIQLVYYYGRPIPVVTQEDVKRKIENNESFILLAMDGHQSAVEGLNLCVLEKIPRYTSRTEVLSIYRAGGLCK
jgi:4-amino-4-deoxy-L-arabinose transferase-like glycosyltransferase